MKVGRLAAAILLLNAAAWAAVIEYPGYVKVENWDNVTGGNNVIALQNDPRYPNSPSSTTFEGDLQWERPGGFNDYGSKVSGYLTPPETTNYVFFIASDDSGSFYLSTDANAANLRLVCADQGWQASRAWTGPGGYSSGDGTTNAVMRRGYNPGPAVLETNGFVWVGPFQNRSDEYLNSPLTNLLTSAAQRWPVTDGNGNAIITLTQGQKYYFEMLLKEGGGGDYCGVAWKKQGDPDPDNGVAGTEILGTDGSTFTNLSVNWPDALSFSQQPASVTVGQGQLVSFTATVLGVPGDSDTTLFTYQWLTNGVPDLGGGGATATYTILSTTLAMNNTTYALAVTSAGTSPAGTLTATSSVATLNVIVDNTPPTISKVVSSETFASVKVTFSESVQNDAVTPGNYVFGGGLTVTDANFDIVTSADTDLDPKNPTNPLNRQSVILYTSTQTEGATYSLTINNIKDMIGNSLTPNTATMYANAFRPRMLTYKRWAASPGGTAINDATTLQADQYQYENPDAAGMLVRAESEPFDSQTGGNYVSRVSGYFIPAVTTNYVFLMSCDNDGLMYLSTDASPANRKLVAADIGWQNARTWTGPGGDATKRRGDTLGGGPFENRTDELLTSSRASTGSGLPTGLPLVPADAVEPEPWPNTNVAGNAVITLTAGTKYYFELWHDEFENGRVEATMKIEGTPDPANGSLSTMTGSLIGGLIDPSTVPPLLFQSSSGGVTTILYTGTLLSSTTVNGTYTPVLGATSPYTVPPDSVGNKFFKSQFP
jgi:hypothetical protein